MNKTIAKIEVLYGNNLEEGIVFEKGRVIHMNYFVVPHSNNRLLYDMKEIVISDEQFDYLSKLLYDAGLNSLFQKSVLLYRDLGSVYQLLLHCVFKDGSEFVYGNNSVLQSEYTSIVRILSSFCENEQDEQHKTKRKGRKCTFESSCCGVALLDNWIYCPQCGKKLDESAKRDTTKEFDFEQTMWFCEECGETMPMSYKFCGKCGGKRHIVFYNPM